jgi:hypothetical protein
MIVFITVWILLARPLLAWQNVAHRGLYHDATDKYAIPENCLDALYRAYDLGLPGVELDLRLASSGEILVTHDLISNRATIIDNDDGKFNPIDVALNLQPSVPAIPFTSQSSDYWNLTPLKAYGRNGSIVNQPDGVSKLETLDAMLAHFKSLNAPNFWLFLDIVDPTILRLAGGLVKEYGLDNLVFLKFFVVKAINSTNYSYTGFDTCAQYARENNLSDLQVIPQINDGELTIGQNGVAYINVFQTTLAIADYLQCWADAQRAYSGNGAALMPMVSASVPSRETKNFQPAYQAALTALTWAGANGRQKMSITTNPDAGRLVNGQCTFWRFQQDNVKAAPFSQVMQDSKLSFAQAANADYVVVDLMGDFLQRNYTGDPEVYNKYLC